MDKKEHRRRIAQEAAIKDKRRIILAAGGILLCVVLIVTVNMRAKKAGADLLTQSNENRTAISGLLPVLDQAVLAAVKDSTPEERVVLEPAAFRELSTNVRTLMRSWFRLLGEPAFDFQNGAAKSAQLRGELFRLRGELLDARPITRVADEEPEYWCHIRSDDGNEFFFVSMMMPTELFGNDNFVLADGYFFKYYRQKMDDDWVTAPLFVGRQIAPSWKRLEPSLTPDLEFMATVKDLPLGTDNRVENINTLPSMWHLANVARSVTADPASFAAAIADPLIMNYDTLKMLSENPEIYRGRMFELGGMIRGLPTTVRVGENPLRERNISSSWIRNDFNGDVLMHLKAPGVFPFDAESGPVVFHGYFLMLWAYIDTKGIPRRTPVFVVVDSFVEDPYTPPFAGQMVMMFLGVAMSIGLLLFWLVRRDRRTSQRAMQKILNRRENRAGS